MIKFIFQHGLMAPSPRFGEPWAAVTHAIKQTNDSSLKSLLKNGVKISKGDECSQINYVIRLPDTVEVKGKVLDVFLHHCSGIKAMRFNFSLRNSIFCENVRLLQLLLD